MEPTASNDPTPSIRALLDAALAEPGWSMTLLDLVEDPEAQLAQWCRSRAAAAGVPFREITLGS